MMNVPGDYDICAGYEAFCAIPLLVGRGAGTMLRLPPQK